MKIESPGTIVITDEGLTCIDFVFALDEHEMKFSEEDIQSIGLMLAFRWALEHILRELEAHRPDPQPLPKELH